MSKLINYFIESLFLLLRVIVGCVFIIILFAVLAIVAPFVFLNDLFNSPKKLNRPLKSSDPICPFDLVLCNRFDSFESNADCERCPRYGNGVRPTSAMPGLESAYNWIKKNLSKKKAVLALLFVLVMFSGCSPWQNDTKPYRYKTIELDGCEYIWVRALAGNTLALTHKGNCKYCLERESGGYYETSDSIQPNEKTN